uniref:Dehydrogenase/reductase SDR family member 13-like n=1 Tax=Phallusia mammillata TaxID=59560 RepID=A0A6F9DB39_9ASCI|nr:dehydrogenase/reductase SDR family member 13-like [Phallusia mammillata]
MGIDGITDYGYHRVFGINHFGTFLLTNLLMKTIKETSKRSPARIVNVSAGLYKLGALDFDYIRSETNGYFSDLKMYGQSKLANIMFTIKLSKLLKGFDVTTYSMHPGAIKSEIGTSFQQSSILNFAYKIISPIFFREGFYGAQTIMYCSLDDNVTKHSGGYFSNCKQEDLTEIAMNDGASQKLWDISVEVTQKYLNENW